MPVAEAAFAAAQELYLLAVVCHLAEEFSGFGIEHHCSAGHFNDLVLAVFTETASGRTALSVSGEDMPAVAQGEECPHVFVATQYHMASASAVSSVGATFWHIFSAMEMA